MSLVNMTEAQKKLAAAIEKFAQVEITRAEADILRARLISTILKLCSKIGNYKTIKSKNPSKSID